MTPTNAELFKHIGLQCCLRPAPLFGAFNGYVRVPAGNYLHGKSYDTNVPMPERWEERTGADYGKAAPIIPLVIQASRGVQRNRITLDLVLRVHGGITFSGKMIDLPGWWLGFDALHADDIGCPSGSLLNAKWLRSKDFVREQTQQLAEEIVAYSKMVHGE